jgi:hypothetical protein
MVRYTSHVNRSFAIFSLMAVASCGTVWKDIHYDKKIEQEWLLSSRSATFTSFDFIGPIEWD